MLNDAEAIVHHGRANLHAARAKQHVFHSILPGLNPADPRNGKGDSRIRSNLVNQVESDGLDRWAAVAAVRTAAGHVGLRSEGTEVHSHDGVDGIDQRQAVRSAPLSGTPDVADLGDVGCELDQNRSARHTRAVSAIPAAVKSGTSNDIIARLNAAINKALATPRVREAFAKLGAEPAGGTPASYGKLVSSQLAHWAKVVEASGMKMQQ